MGKKPPVFQQSNPPGSGEKFQIVRKRQRIGVQRTATAATTTAKLCFV